MSEFKIYAWSKEIVNNAHKTHNFVYNKNNVQIFYNVLRKRKYVWSVKFKEKKYKLNI